MKGEMAQNKIRLIYPQILRANLDASSSIYLESLKMAHPRQY